ncbi:MAG: hypothetical protein Q9186_007648, partial [Xanthomendoza sp. 1 TL-2023]
PPQPPDSYKALGVPKDVHLKLSILSDELFAILLSKTHSDSIQSDKMLKKEKEGRLLQIQEWSKTLWRTKVRIS